MHLQLERFEALKNQPLPQLAHTAARLILVGLALTVLTLWMTPWVQTAAGNGEISALNPDDRIQAISALVPGLVGHWHVQEGQQLSADDPIVTLVDTDSQLIERLGAEQAAVVHQHHANMMATETSRLDLDRREKLFEKGLVSRRELEQSQIKLEELKARQAESQARVKQMDVRLARQSSQTKRAPRDGTILRLVSGGRATLINAGDTLATFMPRDVERAVVLNISGLDAPLVRPGQAVRLQFEGWPVLQFSGWPSVATGTFGGRVKFVEPVAAVDGSFRAWIVEDQSERPWPNEDFARLGSKTRGWILLSEVSLGYEIWRQLNNFPPRNGGDYLGSNASGSGVDSGVR